LPLDLAKRMFTALLEADTCVAVAHNGVAMQPVFALISSGLLKNLESFLEQGGRKVEDWLRSQPLALADFSDQPEAFVNINTPQEHIALEKQMNSLRTC
jgi:molybdopterin-guanine dinucleotide biosynthesis protein A